MQVGLMTENYNFIINNLDIESINLKPYSFGGANITVFRILDPENVEMKIFEDFLREEMAAIKDDDDDDNDEQVEDGEKSELYKSMNQVERISSFIVQDIKSENCIEEGEQSIIHIFVWWIHSNAKSHFRI